MIHGLQFGGAVIGGTWDGTWNGTWPSFKKILAHGRLPAT
jgi:hypothetical protein